MQAAVAARTASREEIRAHVAPAITKDHWELSACSRNQIICVSGQTTTYTTTPPSMAALVSRKCRLESGPCHMVSAEIGVAMAVPIKNSANCEV